MHRQVKNIDLIAHHHPRVTLKYVIYLCGTVVSGIGGWKLRTDFIDMGSIRNSKNRPATLCTNAFYTSYPGFVYLKRYIKKTIHPLEVLSRYRDPQPQVDEKLVIRLA